VILSEIVGNVLQLQFSNKFISKRFNFTSLPAPSRYAKPNIRCQFLSCLVFFWSDKLELVDIRSGCTFLVQPDLRCSLPCLCQVHGLADGVYTAVRTFIRIFLQAPIPTQYYEPPPNARPHYACGRPLFHEQCKEGKTQQNSETRVFLRVHPFL
jgi:hypothetical protein